MFSFFQKKRFLVDYLHGLVDIHNHILPGIDDGAKTLEDSINLLNGFAEIGVTNFICTPHIMSNLYPNNPETIKSSFLSLQKEVDNQGINVDIDFAAEHMIDDDFESILAKGEVLSLRKNYLLVEMSYLQASINFSNAIHQIATHKYFPILAHPERYIYLQNKMGKHKAYKNEGILYQLNLLSLGDYYGNDTQQTAHKLLDNDLIDFVATDIHNINQLNHLKRIKITNKQLNSLLGIIDDTIFRFH